MGEAIGQLLPFAVGVAISPTPIVAVVLMLVTPRARSNGLAFLAGWILGIALAGAVLLAIAGPSGASEDGDPAAWTYWLKLMLGLLLVLVAVRQWRGRPHAGEEAPTPKWMGALDNFTPSKAAGAAVLLGTVNPKNLLFIVGGAAAVAQTGIPAGQQAAAWAVFCLLASLGVATPLVIYFAMGKRAAGMLEGLKTWMATHNTAVMAVLCLIVGVKLVGDAITGFSG
jgi:threonine/homoserine/homoserine lactone efflux protein